MRREDALAMAAIVIAFAVAVIVVNPRGDFPLDDDWDFAAVTWNLASTGTFTYTPFTTPIVVLQAIWGALWTLLFGQSFHVLRASTLTLSLASTLLFFAILRKMDVRTPIALFAALAFFFHPLFFWASFTFMTHVPAVFVDVAATLLLAMAVRKPTPARVAAAAIVATACAFVRQTGACTVAAAFLAVVLARRAIGPEWKRLAVAYAGGGAFIAATVLATRGFMVTTTGQAHLPHGGIRSLVLAAHYAFFNFQNAALFFAPLLLMARRRLPVILTTAIAIVLGAPAVRMLLLGRSIPYPGSIGNVFVNFGLGPHLLRDTSTLHMPYPYGVVDWVKVVLMIASAIGAIVAATMTVSAVRDENVVVRFAALHCLIGTALVSFTTLYFDRYSIDTIWPIAIILALGIRERVPVPYKVVLAGVALFSIISTAEYFAWNRARWEAFAALRAHGVRLEQMDGGYEVNAILILRTGHRALGKPGMGVVDDQFILAFNRVPGYSEIGSVPYPRLLGLAEGRVRILRRNR